MRRTINTHRLLKENITGINNIIKKRSDIKEVVQAAEISAEVIDKINKRR
jgi:hypothetical protein